jgi:hypothetical protein
MRQIIGISGAARCGKDTFANSLVEFFKLNGIAAERIALADELKWEVRSFLQDTLGIDSFTTNDDEKAIIRPFLVFWGTEVRRKMNENCWIEALESNAPSNKLLIVSDIRYPNEQNWVKESGGVSIFIDRMKDGELIDGANDHEKKYNPILRENCDYCFTWNTIPDGDNKDQIIGAIVDQVISECVSQELLDQWKVTYSLSKG